MLERINLTTSERGVRFFFKEGSLEEKIFDAITYNLNEFYSTEFLHELVDKPFLQDNLPEQISDLKGYSEYYLTPTSSENGRPVISRSKNGKERVAYRWRHRLESEFIDLKTSWRKEQRFLGCIFHYKNNLKNHNLDFFIFNIQNYDYSFKLDEETSKKHARKYFDFVNKLMNLQMTNREFPLLYIIRLETDYLWYLEAPSHERCVNAREVLYRKLRRLDDNIKLPIVLLGENKLVNLAYPQTDTAICRLSPEREAQILFDFLEKPEDFGRKDLLTGTFDNHLKVMVYPYSVDYENTLKILKEKLRGKRMIEEEKVLRL